MFFFLYFSMSPFDLICSFGLVMPKQLIQQTCLMRCEVCTQTQLSYPLPTFLLSSLAYTRGRSRSLAQSEGQIEASLLRPETTEADHRSVIHNTLTLCPLTGCWLSCHGWWRDKKGRRGQHWKRIKVYVKVQSLFLSLFYLTLKKDILLS